MNVYEMEGFLRGKCMPRDILVNESTAAYLVRKLNEATALKAERDALAVRNEQLMAFVTEGFNIAGQGGSWCGGDIQEFGEKLGLFARETYQPVLHGYHCGHEPGEDSVYVITKSATSAAVAAIEARVWAEAKDFAKSMLATDSDDHIDFLFDGKIKQLQEAK